MTRAMLKSDAKQQIKGNIGILFVITLIDLLISLALSTIPVVGSLIDFLISSAITLSVTSIYINLTYGEKPKIADMFSCFDIWGKALWLNIITAFFIFLWALLFFIPAIIKAYAYSMAPYILAENPYMTAREALDESKRITDGHKLELFKLNLSFIGWILLVAVTFGIASIYVAPYMNATMANFYHSIKTPAAHTK